MAPRRADKYSFRVKHYLTPIYGCLGVSCSKVGGFLQSSGTSYWMYAEPCRFAPVPTPVTAPDPTPVTAPTLSNSDSGSSSDPVPLIFGLFCSLLPLLLAVGWSFNRSNSNQILQDIETLQTELSLDEVNDMGAENDVFIEKITDTDPSY